MARNDKTDMAQTESISKAYKPLLFSTNQSPFAKKNRVRLRTLQITYIGCPACGCVRSAGVISLLTALTYALAEAMTMSVSAP